MTDYTSSSEKGKQNKELEAAKPEKKEVQKVVTGVVVVKKKPLGRKIKDYIIAVDVGSVTQYVMRDIIFPAAKNMLFEAGAKGWERTLYGENAIRSRQSGSPTRIAYHNPSNPLNRGDYRDPRTRPPDRTRIPRRGGNDYLFTEKDEADTVLERMKDLIDMYQVATMADLNDLSGLPTSYVDNKWGWDFLGSAQIHQIPQGWIIDFPPAQPID